MNLSTASFASLSSDGSPFPGIHDGYASRLRKLERTNLSSGLGAVTPFSPHVRPPFPLHSPHHTERCVCENKERPIANEFLMDTGGTRRHMSVFSGTAQNENLQFSQFSNSSSLIASILITSPSHCVIPSDPPYRCTKVFPPPPDRGGWRLDKRCRGTMSTVPMRSVPCRGNR